MIVFKNTGQVTGIINKEWFFNTPLIIISVERKFTYDCFNPVDNDGIKPCLITALTSIIYNRLNFTHFTHSFQG